MIVLGVKRLIRSIFLRCENDRKLFIEIYWKILWEKEDF